MCAIQNFHVDWYVNNSSAVLNPKKVGTFNASGDILFTSVEITHITKKFLQLYKNRQNKFQDNLKNHHYIKSDMKGLRPKAPKFEPEISKKNADLA